MNIPRPIIKAIIDALLGIIVFISVDQLYGDIITKYYLIFIIIGLALIIFAFKIPIPKKSTRLIGGIFTFIGFKKYIIQYIGLYPYWFLLGGLIMFFLSDQIVDLIEKNG